MSTRPSRVGRRTTGERLGGFIYGTIIVLAVVVAGARAYEHEAGHIAGLVAVTVLVFWLAHVYAHALAHAVPDAVMIISGTADSATMAMTTRNTQPTTLVTRPLTCGPM